jgi:hypothetical protein
MNYHIEDFTEEGYRRLLQLAKAHWEFIFFTDYQKPGRFCLWRHDIDFSVHRAYRLAQIEAEEDVKSTYFIHLHSKFYNAMESDVTRLILDIRNLGHQLGLHFDPEYYGDSPENLDWLDHLRFEQRFLEQMFQIEISAFSIHIPELRNWLSLSQDGVGGMINAYGQFIREHYSYVSDSNGIWRHRRLRDLLEAAEDEKLHILTHPEWWTPEPMSPRMRVTRCIEGRAAKQHQWYDEIVAKTGRENIR